MFVHGSLDLMNETIPFIMIITFIIGSNKNLHFYEITTFIICFVGHSQNWQINSANIEVVRKCSSFLARILRYSIAIDFNLGFIAIFDL